MIQIEHRPYNPDSTVEEIQMLRDRVTLYNEDTILCKEVSVQSEFSFQILTKEIAKHINESNACYLIIDLVNASAPDSKLRVKLKEAYSSLTEKVEYMAIFTEKNSFLNLFAKFFLRGTDFKEYSIHKTLKQALKAIETNKLKK